MLKGIKNKYIYIKIIMWVKFICRFNNRSNEFWFERRKNSYNIYSLLIINFLMILFLKKGVNDLMYIFWKIKKGILNI